MTLCNLVRDHEGFGEAYCRHLEVLVKTRNLNLVLFLWIPLFRKVNNSETPAIPDHWKVNTCCSMAVSLKWDVILPQFLYCVKAHILPFSVRFQNGPKNFAHMSATWKAQTQHFCLKSEEEQRQKKPLKCCSSLSTLGPTSQKERTWSNTGTWRRSFCWSWMHNPQTWKTVSNFDCRYLTLNGCTS